MILHLLAPEGTNSGIVGERKNQVVAASVHLPCMFYYDELACCSAHGQGQVPMVMEEGREKCFLQDVTHGNQTEKLICSPHICDVGVKASDVQG